jgi:hypothetical protein
VDKPILIGLNGLKGSGKNTVAEFIRDWAEESGQEAQLQGFADRLKLSFARILVPDCTLEEALAFCDVIKEIGGVKFDTILPKEIFHRFGVKTFVTGREALQNYGTEGHRHVFGDDFWIEQLLPIGFADNGDSISDMDYPAWWDKWDDVDFALVTDVRFADEAQRINELGGLMGEVVRPSLKDDGDTHATEQKLDSKLFDFQIVNDGTLEQLKTKVYAVMDYQTRDIEYEEHQKEQLGEKVYHGL